MIDLGSESATCCVTARENAPRGVAGTIGALEGETSLLVDLSIALAAALAGGWIATRLGFSSIIGYVAAGLVISPFTPGFSGDLERLRRLADVGVVLLLFAIGVQFSVSDLLRAGWKVAVGASAQVAAVIGISVGAGTALGFPVETALYAGAAASISSSVVIVKLLERDGDLASAHGRTALAWSIVQDLWGILLIVLLGSDAEGEALARDLSLVALATVAFVVGALAFGVRVVPFLMARVAEERSRELFVIAVAALAIGTALMSEWVGLSIALGAFVAGLVVSESDLSHRVLGDLLPTRDVFAVLFFVAAGMLLDPAVLLDEWALVLFIAAVIVFVKTVVAGAILALFTRPHTALLTAAALVPVAEYAFLIAAAGLDSDRISEDAFGAIIAAAAISIVASTLALSAARYALMRPRGEGAAEPPPRPAYLGRNAVVCGFGEVGRIVASIVSPRFSTIVVEDDARAAREARERGFTVIEGSLAAVATVDRMELENARLLVIAVDDAFAARLLAERARVRNPHMDIISRAANTGEARNLVRAGVDRPVVAEREAAFELARHALERFGIASQQSLRIVQMARARFSEGG